MARSEPRVSGSPAIFGRAPHEEEGEDDERERGEARGGAEGGRGAARTVGHVHEEEGAEDAEVRAKQPPPEARVLRDEGEGARLVTKMTETGGAHVTPACMQVT